MELRNCKDFIEQGPFESLIISTSSAVLGAAVGLISASLNPLLTATIAAVATVASVQIAKALDHKYSYHKGIVAFGSLPILTAILSLTSTALGFPISVPLSLLLSGATVVGFFVGASAFEYLNT